MDSSRDEAWHDSWTELLAQFDESLRLGRPETRAETGHPEIERTRQFLVQLQSIWPRAAKKIGPYTVMRTLGQGTIGPAYLVEDSVQHRPYVLKFLWPDLSHHPQTRQQFVSDARLGRAPPHPAIAGVHEVRDAGPVCLIVIEYCHGASLAQWRRQQPAPLAWPIAAAFLAKLADILDAAHAAGRCHGNLKPSNLFLDHADEITPRNLPEATLRLGDFGLARAVQETRLPMHGALAWPLPQYLAPEQLRQREQPATPACDIYALSAIGYELLTARSVVKGTTRDEVSAQVRDAPVPPRQYRPEIPAPFEALLMQALQRRAENRPASARILAERLRDWIPSEAPPASPPPPSWWKRWLGWQ